MTPKPEKTLLLTMQGTFSASLSENYALIGTAQGYGELWKIKREHLLIHRWKHTEQNNAIIATDISANEKFAITAENDSIAWWRIKDGTLLSVWSLPGILSATISSDGQFALIGLSNKAIYFALQYGKTQYAFAHEGKVLVGDLSDSGRYALTGSENKTAKLWDLKTGKLKHSWQHRNQLSTVALSYNDKYALTNSALSQTRLWKIANGKLHKEIGPTLVTLTSAAFSNDNRSLLTAQSTNRIDLWDIETGKRLKFWRAKKLSKEQAKIATTQALTFSNNNRKFQSFSSDGFLQKWRK